MKVANNMDSVFAGFTEKELEFDLMFDSDDCLIDLVAGVNESGELFTGANPEDNYEFQLDENGDPLNGLTFDELLEAEDPITDKCDCGRRAGAVKDAGHAPEGAKKDQDGEFNTPEGMKSEVPGSNSSAESKAHDVTKEIEDAIKENNQEGPIEDKDADDLRDGKAKYAGDALEGTKKDQDGEFNTPEGMKSEVPGSNSSAESKAHDVTKEIEDAIKEGCKKESDEDIEAGEEEDLELEEGCKKESACKNEVCEKCGQPKESCKCEAAANEAAIEIDLMMEGFDPSSETDAEFKIAGDQGPLEDKEADDLRDGKAKYASSNVEGEKQEVIGAATESIEIDLMMEGDDGCLDCQVTDKDGLDDVTVPDKIQTDGDANIIPPDRDTQSSDGVEPASESVIYSGWITHVTEADEKVPLTSDDADIEAVDKGEFDGEGELNLDVDYDDDELIDIAINGGDI